MADYKSLSELKKSEQENVDWRQPKPLNRNSWLTVVAPHGGTIEPFTEEIARAIADTNYNLFVFEGLRRKESARPWLHVTSTTFDDKRLKQLQASSLITLSVHGATSPKPMLEEKITWLGGRNTRLRDRICNSLIRHGFAAKEGAGSSAGTAKSNFVNRTLHNGVQLEISRSEREALSDNPTRWARYIKAIREGLRDWKQAHDSRTYHAK
jgi:phage replication-related protein YjqB (UPF0714/DUF867 family)